MSKKLYRFTVDCYYGELNGLFVAEAQEIENLLGKEVYFGEVLGKHSAVSIKMEPDLFECLSSDQDFIDYFEKIDAETGYNPLVWIDEETDNYN